MFNNLNGKSCLIVSLVILAGLIALILIVAVGEAGAAVEFGEAQEGCFLITEIGWSGTAASTSDEFYEILNICDFPVSTDGWYLETTATDLTQATAYLPIVEIPSGVYCLFERTDDQAVSNRTACGIHGSAGTGESLTGIFTNSGLVSFALWNDTDPESYHEMTIDDVWPAGSSSPRASMQRVGGVWYTSNQGDGALDANGDPILGTPGAANQLPSGNPDTCGVYPDKIDYDLDMTLFEDMSTQASITVQADLWGVADGGTLVATNGEVVFVWTTQWEVASFTYDEGTSDACIDAFELIKDGSENVLNYQPSNMPVPHPSYWPGYATWLNGILQFQKSGLSTTFLPAVQN